LIWSKATIGNASVFGCIIGDWIIPSFNDLRVHKLPDCY